MPDGDGGTSTVRSTRAVSAVWTSAMVGCGGFGGTVAAKAKKWRLAEHQEGFDASFIWKEIGKRRAGLILPHPAKLHTSIDVPDYGYISPC